MADIKLFRLDGDKVQELQGHPGAVEKSVQTLMERHLESLLGVKLLASEYSTGKTHGGRIDTLGIDENGCPVIIEYKRTIDENVTSQGLYYLEWLLDHKGEFKLLVMGSLGQEVADGIEWLGPRLLCIAGDFTKYDTSAVQQMKHNVELIRYRRYGDDLLLLELVNASTPPVETLPGHLGPKTPVKTGTVYPTATEVLQKADARIKELFESLKTFILARGDDIQFKPMRSYFAFRRIRNFACVDVRSHRLLVFVKVSPDSITLEPGFTRDVREIGHFGTGDLEITIASPGDLERAKPLIIKSDEVS
jgi:predicted transport protein